VGQVRSLPVMVRFSTGQGYAEITRSQVLEPTSQTFGRPVVWRHPAFAEKCLFARNDKELVCVSLAAEQ
jgi:hypothetical protein